ncbi:MAG: PKD domain-containing protein, partial [Bacteroidota bacterium]
TSSPTVNAAGTYTVTITDPSNGCTNTGTVSVTSSITPPPLTSGPALILTCTTTSGGISVSTTTPGVTYSWTGPGIVSGATTSCPTVNAAGVYSVTVTDPANGCTSTTSITVTTNVNPPNANAGTQQEITCAAPTVALNGSSSTVGATALWSGPGIVSGSSTFTPTVNAPGNYTVTVTDPANGCTSTSTVTVTIDTIHPTLTMGPGIQLNCVPPSSTITASSGTSGVIFTWNGPGIVSGSNTSSPSVNAAGVYTVIVTDPSNGCSNMGSLTVTAPPMPSALITGINDITCNGGSDGSATVTASGGTPGYLYLWNDSPPAQTTTTATSLTAGTWTVTVTDMLGCTTTASALISEPLPVVIHPPGNKYICNGQTAVLTASVTGGTGNITYFWDGIAGSASYSVSPAAQTTYSVYAIDGNGCYSDTGYVTVSVAPSVVIALFANETYVCPGDPAVISANIYSGIPPYYVYDSYGNVISPPLIIYPNQDTTITLYVEDQCGSLASATTAVKVYPLPPVSFAADFYQGCVPFRVHFNENSPDEGQSYVWNFGDNDLDNLSFSKDPVHVYDDPGVYDVTVTVTSATGCVNSLTIEDMITVFTGPEAKFSADPEVVSIIKPIVFFLNQSIDADSYTWTFGDGDTSNVINPWHTYPIYPTGVYNVMLIAHTDKGCADTAFKSVTIKNELTFYAPSAFSPDFDGINDFFLIKGNGLDPRNFKLIIYDRWGETVFETYDLLQGWDGRIKGGDIGKNGSYTWLCIYRDMYGTEHQEAGAVTIIR